MEFSHEVALGNFGIGPTSAAGRLVAVSLLVSKSTKEFFSILHAYIGRWIKLYLVASSHGTFSRFFWFNFRKPYLAFALFTASAFILWMVRRPRAVRAKAQLVRQRTFWRNVMAGAYTYDEWAHAAKMFEKECGRRKDADLYDEDLVRTKLQELQMRRKEGVMQDMLFCIRTDLVRNLGNMCNPELHMGRFQAPKLIREYIDEVRYHLRAVCDSDSEDLPLEEKLAFIRETRHAFGRTALLLSGGASLGAFHVGVVRTLMQHGLLPRVVAGASVGSIMCSVIATRNWSELQTFFGDSLPTLQFFDQLGGIFAIVNRLFTRGVFHEIRKLQHLLRELTQNMTFQEAFDSTGRVLGISVCSPRKHEPARCLNYLTSPHVVIWSAVTASCAFPGLFEAQELMAKDRHGQLVPYHTPVQVVPEDQNLGVRHWRDGSLESDLPMVQLKELFNVNHFVVSQANPHIAPLLRLKDLVRKYGGNFAAKLAHLLEMEVKHRCNQIWEMGFPMGGIAKLFAQDWEGHVTIVMPATLAQFAKIIQNPTPLELQKAVNQGRKCTWEKLSAINANCGIELMLDECMSELNHRLREKKRLERSSLALVSLVKRASGAKRIPSWNCFARENSWGSLDEEAMADSSSQGVVTAGTPRNHHDGSDSESESVDLRYHSWTRAGGPLMRTASATQFIQELQAVDVIARVNKEDMPCLNGKDAGIGGSNSLVSLGSEQACNDVVIERSRTSEHDMGLLDANKPEHPAYGIAEASLREVIECAVTSDDEGAHMEKQPLLKSLEHGAFGSFINKLDDFGTEK